ncbi:TPA: DUF504 domain-containing protein [Candidatus Bathyarchaeota archaeon]|nr:DUF504 domain-containing protein [Candidatus Bathyarchaeota archaeon]
MKTIHYLTGEPPYIKVASQAGLRMPKKPKSREIIERILWDKRFKAEDYLLSYVHRGIEGERKTIPLKKVLNVRGSWVSFLDEEGLENRIPLHRIVEIRNVKTGEKIWIKASA